MSHDIDSEVGLSRSGCTSPAIVASANNKRQAASLIASHLKSNTRGRERESVCECGLNGGEL